MPRPGAQRALFSPYLKKKNEKKFLAYLLSLFSESTNYKEITASYIVIANIYDTLTLFKLIVESNSLNNCDPSNYYH